MAYQLTIAETNTVYDVMSAWRISRCQSDFLQYGKLVSVTPREKGWCVTTSGHIRAGKFSLVPNPAPDGPLHADSTYTLVRI